MPASSRNGQPLDEPFPVLASGSRWVLPAGNSLGAGQLDGQGFTYYPRKLFAHLGAALLDRHPARTARQTTA